MASYPMDIKALLDKLGLSYLAEPLLLQVLLVVLTTVLANIIAHFLLRYLTQIARMTTSHWDDALVKAAKGPAPIVIWLIGVTYADGIAIHEKNTDEVDRATIEARRSWLISRLSSQPAWWRCKPLASASQGY